MNPIRGRRGRRAAPFVCAGLSGSAVYLTADLVGIFLAKAAPDITSLVLPIYVGLVAFLLTLISAWLGRMAEAKLGVNFPRGIQLAWGGLLGVSVCAGLDLPELNLSRWLPYLMALGTGILVSAVYDWTKVKLNSADEVEYGL